MRKNERRPRRTGRRPGRPPKYGDRPVSELTRGVHVRIPGVRSWRSIGAELGIAHETARYLAVVGLARVARALGISVQEAVGVVVTALQLSEGRDGHQ